MKHVLIATALSLGLGGAAFGHGSEPLPGEVILDAPEYHAALGVSDGAMTVRLLSHTQDPIDPTGWTGSAVLMTEPTRLDLTLSPNGEMLIAHDPALKPAPGTRGTLTLTDPQAQSTDLRFTLP